MLHHWPEKFAKDFLNDLFFWVWQRMDTRATEMWSPAEAKTAGAPWQRTYNHEVNTSTRPEFRSKGEAYMCVVEDKICNILNSNYGITLANKTKRTKQKREYVSYVHNPAFYSITPTNDHYMLGEWTPFSLEKEGKQGTQINTDVTEPNRGSLPGSSDRIKKKPEKEDEMNIDWQRIKDPATLNQNPSNPVSPMSKSDLETGIPTPIPFPSLNNNAADPTMTQLLENPAFMDKFLKLADQSGLLNQFKATTKEDGEEDEEGHPIQPSSLGKSNSKRSLGQTNLGIQAEGMKELTSSLLSKSKTEIKFKELTLRDIISWGDAVEHYENTFGLWDRNQIDRSLRRRINYRWTLDAYHQLLPEGLQENHNLIKDDSWMEHETISTVELTRFLKKTCGVGDGTTNLHAGYDEMLDLVKTYSLPMRRGTISRGIEDFVLKVKELLETNEESFTPHEEKELSKALHAMVLKSRRDGVDDPVLDVAVGRAVLDEMKTDNQTSFAKSISLLKNGLSAAIK
jgi:hypothetical protein